MVEAGLPVCPHYDPTPPPVSELDILSRKDVPSLLLNSRDSRCAGTVSRFYTDRIFPGHISQSFGHWYYGHYPRTLYCRGARRESGVEQYVPCSVSVSFILGCFVPFPSEPP